MSTINGKSSVIIQSQCGDRLHPTCAGMVFKQGMGKVPYIRIERMYDTLNRIFGDRWSTEPGSVLMDERGLGIAIKMVIRYDDGSIYRTVTGCGGDTRFGDKRDGGVFRNDTDKCIKTGESEAIKKCANKLRIGHYLWDEEERQAIKACLTEKGEYNGKRYKISNLQRDMLMGCAGQDDKKLDKIAQKFLGKDADKMCIERHNADSIIRRLLGISEDNQEGSL